MLGLLPRSPYRKGLVSRVALHAMMKSEKVFAAPLASGAFSLPRGYPSISARGTYRRSLNSSAGLFPFVHSLASVRQDLPHEYIEPNHWLPPFASSTSRKEEPRCRSNPPSLENLAKVQMR